VRLRATIIKKTQMSKSGTQEMYRDSVYKTREQNRMPARISVVLDICLSASGCGFKMRVDVVGGRLVAK